MKKYFIIILLVIIFLPIFKVDAKINLNIKEIDLSKYDTESKIILYCNVDDNLGLPIKNLTKDNFKLNLTTINKKIEIDDFKIETVLPNNEPIYIALLLDTSESMIKNNAFSESKKAAQNFIDSLRDIDKVMIVSFSDKVEIKSDFTNNKIKLKEIINNLNTGEYTKLYDAINVGLEKINEILSNRKTVILLSDGKDSKEEGYKFGSNSTIDDVLRRCELYKIPIYIIGLGEADLKTLDRLATISKGLSLYTSEPTQIKNLYNQILNSLKDTYRIEIIDPEPAKKMDFRKILIEVNVNGEIMSSEKTFVVKNRFVQNKNIIPFISILYILIIVILIIIGLIFILYKKRKASSVYYKSKEEVKEKQDKKNV
ncbi:MAG: VWA domain-containing protein [Caldisericia bacterium]|nr:VWA domain-containing protein [Caldisericia bacterium]